MNASVDMEESGVDIAAVPRNPDAHEVFTALLMKNHASLMSFILSLLPNWADAEDVMQQTSVVLWRKFDEFQTGTEFLAWSSKVARYVALNYYRKLQSDRHVFQQELVELLADESMEDASRLEQERNLLQGCLAKLDKNGRSLLTACYESGMTFAQVASQLGCTANSVYKGLNRIREALLACVERALRTERS